MKENKDIYNLIPKKLSGEITPDDNNILESWINSSNDNKNEFDEYAKIWDETGKININTPDIDNSWNEFEDMMSSDKVFTESINSGNVKQLNTSKEKKNNSSKFYLPAAAVIIFFLGVSFWMNYFNPVTNYVEIITLNSETKDITLTDGSIVKLNSGSKIRYSKSYSTDEVRTIELWGEAFFNVTKDSRPFHVNTENSKIKVLGTQFNVWTRNNETRVLVKSGKVSIISKDNADSEKILVKGEKANIENQISSPVEKNVDVDELLGWLDGKLVFEKSQLAEVLQELERKYDVNISLPENDKGEKTITGTFHDQPIGNIISSICLTLNYEFKIKNQIYELKSKR